MKPHKILFVITTSDFGGTESYLLRLVAGLDRARFEPIVLSLCPLGRIGREIASLGIRVESFDMAAKPKPHQMLAGILRLWRFVRRENIELVQALLYRANVLAAAALKLPGRRIPLVTGQRSLIPAGRGRDARLQRCQPSVRSSGQPMARRRGPSNLKTTVHQGISSAAGQGSSLMKVSYSMLAESRAP